jgi:hypothetical protein
LHFQSKRQTKTLLKIDVFAVIGYLARARFQWTTNTSVVVMSNLSRLGVDFLAGKCHIEPCTTTNDKIKRTA